MPRYINKSSNPISYNNTTFISNQEAETYDTLENRAIIIGTNVETYNIAAGVSDVLDIRFNEETVWTSITLTAGGARTAANIVANIEAAYPGVASVEGGKVRIDAPITSNILNAIYVKTTSTSAAVLGLTINDVNPVACVSLQAFKISQNAEPYNIAANNNTFIFKANNGQVATVVLTVDAVKTAADIVAELNYAYETANGDATKVALSVTPVVGEGTYIKLLAPIYNNNKSILYIKSTNNTSLTILGFTGDDYEAVSKSLYPNLLLTNILPLYNPFSAETVLTFAAAGTQYHYLTDPDTCKELQIIRVTIAAAFAFTCYIESVSNTPPFTLKSDETFSINLLNRRVSKLIVTAGAAGNLTIRELKG